MTDTPEKPDLFPLWADNPSDQDLLGFGEVADPIVEAVKRDHLDPVAIGLIGPWGSGKSTVLSLIEARLTGDTTIVVVRTYPWEYDPSLDVKATLIGDVLQAIRERAKAEAGAEQALIDIAKKLAKRVKWAKAVSLVAKTAVTVSIPKWEDVTEIFDLDSDTTDSDSDPTLVGFRTEFKAYLDAAKNVSRVVVLVDDLDRCLPDTVVATLEGIKLFLAVPKMAFVVAADEAPVIDAIKERYKESDEKAEMSRQYLEKIIQIPVRVPNLGLASTEAYLALMLIERRLDKDQFRGLVSNVNQRRRAGETDLLEGHALTLGSEAEGDLALAAELAPILYAQLSGNPRRLKRFLNAYWIRTTIAAARNVNLAPAALAKLIVLEELHRPQFKELISWAADGTLKDRLSKLESEKGAGEEPWTNAQLAVWAKQGPALAEVDLLPYLQLAASLSQLTFTGSGLSAQLQELLGRLTGAADSARKSAATETAALMMGDRLLVAAALVTAIRAEPTRQAPLMSSMPVIIGKDDEVAAVVVERLRTIDPAKVEAPTPTWLASLRELPSIKAFLDEVAASDKYDPDVRDGAKNAGTPASGTAKA
jgi:hypothetical protein